MSEDAIEHRTRVIVVGAGYAGLTAALFLAWRGVPVTLVERHPSTSVQRRPSASCTAAWSCCARSPAWRRRSSPPTSSTSSTRPTSPSPPT
ncbi:FAD-dependent oxidoreductase [Micromonospora sp. BRA006-A]|nr:FAD-dependent oxidoreductase [Micromonospora sp. BRA006-A]